ncbi:MAG: hypothetical protein IPP56_10570 [Bacteroidetes bacterium]|nr:hypothetical protein [Bacteroidota bacterium]
MNRQALFICYFFFYLMVSCAVSVAQELEYATGTKLYLPATAPSLLDHASLQKTLNTESPCTSENTFWGYNVSGTMLVEYALNNGSIAFTGNTVSNIPGYGVAICSNLDSAISSQLSMLAILLPIVTISGHKIQHGFKVQHLRLIYTT